jgi:dihydroorotase
VKGELEDRGCFVNLHEIDVDACVRTIEEGNEHIWGVAANLTSKACGDNDPREVMRRTLEIAELTNRPILYGPRREPSDWPLADQLALLRNGDVFTYCFHSDAESIVDSGEVVDSAWEARERGVLFDVGHGKGTEDMGVGPIAIANGFLPDTISSDVYNNHLGWNPPHDLARTLSRMITIGMPETEALRQCTLRPAEILGMSGQIGTLAPGSDADLTVLRWSDSVPLARVNGDVRYAPCLESVLTVRAGQIIGL